MRRLIFQLSLVLFYFSWSNTLADHREFKFDEANQFYQNGQYEESIAAYQEILEMGYESADLYYNIGNAHYKLGESAKAILYYERAVRLQPNDEDVQFNLQIANLQVIDKIPSIPELFYVKFFREVTNTFSLRTITIFTLIVYLSFFTFIILWILSKSMAAKRIFKTLSFAFAILLLLSVSLFSSKAFTKRVDAIVMITEVDVRSAPTSDSTEIFKIHSGLKVKITDRRGDWIEIRLSDGKEGWLETSAVEVI